MKQQEETRQREMNSIIDNVQKQFEDSTISIKRRIDQSQKTIHTLPKKNQGAIFAHKRDMIKNIQVIDAQVSNDRG